MRKSHSFNLLSDGQQKVLVCLLKKMKFSTRPTTLVFLGALTTRLSFLLVQTISVNSSSFFFISIHGPPKGLTNPITCSIKSKKWRVQCIAEKNHNHGPDRRASEPEFPDHPPFDWARRQTCRLIAQ